MSGRGFVASRQNACRELSEDTIAEADVPTTDAGTVRLLPKRVDLLRDCHHVSHATLWILTNDDIARNGTITQ